MSDDELSEAWAIYRSRRRTDGLSAGPPMTNVATSGRSTPSTLESGQRQDRGVENGLRLPRHRFGSSAAWRGACAIWPLATCRS